MDMDPDIEHRTVPATAGGRILGAGFRSSIGVVLAGAAPLASAVATRAVIGAGHRRLLPAL